MRSRGDQPGKRVPKAMVRHLPSRDGTPLLHRVWRGEADRPVACLGHTQPTHSGHFTDLAEALAGRGWTVHAGDLRGHGGSVGGRQKRAHLDPQTGWSDLTDDFRTQVAHAFDGVPFERRVLLVQNTSALLALELLKDDPAIAGHIVMTPPAYHKELAVMTQAFIKARMDVHPVDEPDEQALHQFYSFWGAQLPDRKHLADVMSADRALVDAIVADEAGFPTPTPAYWAATFAGYARAWTWVPDGGTPGAQDGGTPGARIDPRTRILILHGAQDALLANGGYVREAADRLTALGARDVASHRMEGARTAVMLDERTLGVSSVIAGWVNRSNALARDAGDDAEEATSVDDVVAEGLRRMGSQGRAGPLSEGELVALCYDAIDDEGRWVELMYRLISLLAADFRPDEARFEDSLKALMPSSSKPAT